MTTQLSDKGLSVLVHAAYHTLLSGEVVREIVLDDGRGSKADPAGVDELRNADLMEIDQERGRLTDAGEDRLNDILQRIRQ